MKISNADPIVMTDVIIRCIVITGVIGSYGDPAPEFESTICECKPLITIQNCTFFY